MSVDRDARIPTEVETIAKEIERYVELHPRSKDSATGIRQWWLSPRSASTSLRTVQQAIDELMRRGVLVEELLPDGGRIYASAGERPDRRGPRDD